MGSIPNDFPISLKSWPPSSNNDANALPTIIQRINIERGGFRDISEESLRQEIAEAEAAKDDGQEESSSDEEEGQEEPDRMKELIAARSEMMANLEGAHQAAGYALDFVSLLISKDMPAQGGLTLTPALKDLVGSGTLGADKLEASRLTIAQRESNKRVAKGWKMQSLNKTADAILEAATRLEKEMETETKYWEQVLAVSNNGWAVCRMPNQKHILGVRFGFSEAAPAFKSQSLAALRRNPDGSISLDQGVASKEPQDIRVRIQADGIITGSSVIPNPEVEDAPAESLILQARNTIFSAELWQELNRETRFLGTFHVQAQEDTIAFPLSSEKTLILDLVPLGDSAPPPPGPDDLTAEGLHLALGMLLCFAHRQNHRRRTLIPTPISGNKRPNPPYSLLRPIITRLNHQQANTSLHALLGSLCTVLKSAFLAPAPTYSIIHSTTQPTTIPNFSLAERTIYSLTDRLESVATLKLTTNTTITITIRSFQQPLAGPTFSLALNSESELNVTCIAPPSLPNIQAVEDYIFFASSCALASLHTSDEADGCGWVRTAQPNVLRRLFSGGKAKQVVFDVSRQRVSTNGSKSNCTLSVAWEWMRHDTWNVANEDRRKHLEASAFGGKRKEQGVYEWRADGEGAAVKSLKSVVEDAEKEEGIDGVRRREQAGREGAFRGN